MNNYAVIHFNADEDDAFRCLFQIKEHDAENYEKLNILKVLIGNNKLVFEVQGDVLLYRWNSGSLRRKVVLVSEENDKIVEFEDDDSALLWYKLNY